MQLQDSVGQAGENADTLVLRRHVALSHAEVIHEFVQLTKPRIALLIVISTAVGYCYGSVAGFNALAFFHALLGTALMAGGSATLNQWFERELDAKMVRTQRRPIPSGKIPARQALMFGLTLSIVGLADLWFFTNSLAAFLGFLTSAGYLFAYTPLKRRGPISTTVGALPGAMPPLIGFAAASASLHTEAWILFAMLFLWQFPHFHAIAWIYRKDYEKAGIKMLAVVKPYGKSLGFEILLALFLLLPVTLAPTFLHMTGKVYLAAAFVLNLVFLYFGARLALERNVERARSLLLASVVYIPALFAFLVFDNPRFYL